MQDLVALHHYSSSFKLKHLSEVAIPSEKSSVSGMSLGIPFPAWTPHPTRIFVCVFFRSLSLLPSQAHTAGKEFSLLQLSYLGS